MATRILITIVLAVFLGSCGIIGTEQFGKQKYTNYKRGKGALVKREKAEFLNQKTSVDIRENVPGELTGSGIIPEVENPAIIEPPAPEISIPASSATQNQRSVDRSQKPYSFRLLGKSADSSAGGGVNDVLMILLCIFIPPLAVYLLESTTTRFWITLICYILGGGFLLSTYFYFGGLWLVAIILAFLAYFGK